MTKDRYPNIGRTFQETLADSQTAKQAEIISTFEIIEKHNNLIREGFRKTIKTGNIWKSDPDSPEQITKGLLIVTDPNALRPGPWDEPIVTCLMTYTTPSEQVMHSEDGSGEAVFSFALVRKNDLDQVRSAKGYPFKGLHYEPKVTKEDVMLPPGYISRIGEFFADQSSSPFFNESVYRHDLAGEYSKVDGSHKNLLMQILAARDPQLNPHIHSQYKLPQ
jgi:hypothetical protein